MDRITKKHLQIFDLYNGNDDTFAKMAKSKEKKLFSGNQFETISELIENQYLVESGKTNEEFKLKHLDKLKQTLEHKNLSRIIKYLSRKYLEGKKEQSLLKNIMWMLWAIFD